MKVIVIGDYNVPSPIKVNDPSKAEEFALDYIKKGEKVLVVGREAWTLYRHIAEQARMSGDNFYLLEALDPVEADYAGVSFNVAFTARLAYLARRPAKDASPEPSSPEKRVTRRALLRAAIVSAAMDYTEKPVEDVLCSKQALKRYCTECSGVCGEDACAASAAYCGIELVKVPGYSRAGLHDMLRTLLSSAHLSYAIFAPRSAIAELLSAVKGDGRFIIIPVSCPYVVGLEELLALVANGIRPIILEAGWERDLKRCKEARTAYLNTVVADYEKLVKLRLLYNVEETADLLVSEDNLKPLPGAREALARGLRPAALLYLKQLGITVKLETPLLGLVTVDQGKCTVCGACARECPALAFKVRESDRGSALLFMHDRCIACGWCAEVCPENAITVSKAVDSRLIGLWSPLVVEEVARCIVCGRPIGPMKLVERVVEKLLLAGFNPENMPTILMCDKCKQKYSLGLIDRDRIDWDYLRRLVNRVKSRMEGGNS